MVNTLINVSAYKGTPPARMATPGSNRQISNRRIYKTHEVLAILDLDLNDNPESFEDEEEATEVINFWTEKCIRDSAKYAFSHDDAKDFIREAVCNGKHTGSEWCIKEPHGVWAACDVYEVLVDVWDPEAEDFVKKEYYLKFAIGKDRNIILTVSCHRPEERR